MKNKELLKNLYNKYNLTPQDIFKSPIGFTIITRSGIDKIQAVAQIETKDKYIETFGESSPQNTRNQYPVAMAEKRAMSRCVLKLTGFYELGVYGEDEVNEIQKK